MPRETAVVDLRPRRRFTAEQTRASLPEPGGFGWRELQISRG